MGYRKAVAEPQPNRMTYAEYLELEEASDTKHEYLRGEIFAMAGGTPEHGALMAAVIVHLGIALGDRPCRIYTSDVRIRIEATELTTYPDASVVCGPVVTSKSDRNAITNPILIVEVLSDSTEAYDRGEKFDHYRHLPSLREYLLVSQRRQKLESYRKNEQGIWMLSEAAAGETLELAAIEGVRLEVDRIYRDPTRPSAS
jgi:Uma2 family endonuclease